MYYLHMVDYEKFLSNLKVLRHKLNLKQETVAEAMGLERTAYTRRENNILGMYVYELIAFMTKYNVEPGALFKDKIDIPDPLETRCLAVCRKAKELGLEATLIEHLDMMEYKLNKAVPEPQTESPPFPKKGQAA